MRKTQKAPEREETENLPGKLQPKEVSPYLRSYPLTYIDFSRLPGNT